MLWRLTICWSWGRNFRFTEFDESMCSDPTIDTVNSRVADVARKISESYAFDCGRLEYPLSPHIDEIFATPLGDSVGWECNDANMVLNEAVESKRKKLEEQELELERVEAAADGVCRG